MNPETVSPDYADQEQTPELLGANDGETKLLMPSSSSTQSAYKAQWHHYGEKVSAFLQNLPNYVTQFFRDNQSPLTTVALIVGAIVGIKLILALLDALNDIPLVEPTLELIGIVYTGWFVYRYLLQASSRQELVQELNTLKEQVLGSGE